MQTENEERKHGIDFEQQFGFNCIYSTNFIEAEWNLIWRYYDCESVILYRRLNESSGKIIWRYIQ